MSVSEASDAVRVQRRYAAGWRDTPPFKTFAPKGAALFGARVAAFLTIGLLVGSITPTAAHDVGREAPAFSTPLPNVPGQSLTAIVVSYAPGGKSPAHQHAGSVYAYVLTGVIRSENSATGAARVYKAGESFFEPPGSTHLVSENASVTNPASLLAIFIADTGATLTFPPK